jgi:chromosome segregation ATPase
MPDGNGEMDLSTYPESLQTYVRGLRAEAKTNREKWQAAESKVAERDTAIGQASSELDRLKAEAEAAAKLRTDMGSLKDQHEEVLAKLSTKGSEYDRLRAAVDTGIPSHAHRLTGATYDELKADAEAFKKDLASGSATGDRTVLVPNGHGAPDPRQAAVEHLASQLKDGNE